jgi:hypothetical protein
MRTTHAMCRRFTRPRSRSKLTTPSQLPSSRTAANVIASSLGAVENGTAAKSSGEIRSVSGCATAPAARNSLYRAPSPAVSTRIEKGLDTHAR